MCSSDLVRADVRALLDESADPLPRAHVVGCERRCGAPHGAHLDVVAQADGTYRIDDRTVPDLRSALAPALRTGPDPSPHQPDPTGVHPA